MIRWTRAVTVAAAGGATAVALGACGSLPDGMDGELTSEWSALPEPSSFEPAALVCHPESHQSVASLAEYQPVDCAEPHYVETVYVGTFGDDTALDDDDQPPARDSGAHREAFEVCEEHAADHLGDDFRAGRLWLAVALPTEDAWAGGSRWFRCDLGELSSIYGEPVEREGSLASALAGPDASLRLGCFEVETDDGAVDTVTAADCDEAHQAEYVGVWRDDGDDYPSPGDSAGEDRVYSGCREVIADYVDVPVDDDLQYRTGVIADWVAESEWAAGDRGFRCYVWLPGEELTESLADAGTDGLPVRTD